MDTYLGTAFSIPGEDEPSKGRILIFSVAAGKLVLETQFEVKGSAYSLAAFNGKLVAAVNSKVVSITDMLFSLIRSIRFNYSAGSRKMTKRSSSKVAAELS